MNFLIIIMKLKELDVIKKNGKFPLASMQDDSRSGYAYYFGIAVGKFVKWMFPGSTVKKNRNVFSYSIKSPEQKYVFGKDKVPFIDRLMLAEIISGSSIDLSESYALGNIRIQTNFRQALRNTYRRFFETTLTYSTPRAANTTLPEFFDGFVESERVLAGTISDVLVSNTIKDEAFAFLVQQNLRIPSGDTPVEQLPEAPEVETQEEDTLGPLLLKAKEIYDQSSGISTEGAISIAKIHLNRNEYDSIRYSTIAERFEEML